MHLALPLSLLLLPTTALARAHPNLSPLTTLAYPECTASVAATDDCAAVINANACYNKYRFTNAQTLLCVDGTSDADKKRKVCACCTCVGDVMCNWATKMKYC